MVKISTIKITDRLSSFVRTHGPAFSGKKLIEGFYFQESLCSRKIWSLDQWIKCAWIFSKVLYIRYTDENKNRQYHFLLSTYSLEVSILQSQKGICRREWNKAKSTCTCPNTCSNTFPNTWYDRNHYFSLGFDTQTKNGQYFWADTVTSGNQFENKKYIYQSDSTWRSL